MSPCDDLHLCPDAMASMPPTLIQQPKKLVKWQSSNAAVWSVGGEWLSRSLAVAQ